MDILENTVEEKMLVAVFVALITVGTFIFQSIFEFLIGFILVYVIGMLVKDQRINSKKTKLVRLESIYFTAIIYFYFIKFLFRVSNGNWIGNGLYSIYDYSRRYSNFFYDFYFSNKIITNS